MSRRWTKDAAQEAIAAIDRAMEAQPVMVESFELTHPDLMRCGPGSGTVAQPVENYRRFCRALGMPFNTGVIAKLKQVEHDGLGSLISFDGSALLLGSRGLLPLIDVVVNAPNLVAINLSGTGVDDESCSALCRALSVHPAIKAIDLSNNKITQSSAPALRLLISATGCSVVLHGNKYLLESTQAALSRLSMAVGVACGGLRPAMLDKNTIDATHTLRGSRTVSFSQHHQLLLRRLQQQKELLRMRSLRRVPPDVDGWTTLGVVASASYEGFENELELLRTVVLPGVNRRLRQYKVHFALSCVYHPPQTLPVGQTAKIAANSADKCIAKNTKIRSVVMAEAADVALFFVNPAKVSEEVKGDWAAKESQGSGAVVSFVYRRKAVRGVPEALRDAFEDFTARRTLPCYVQQRREFLQSIAGVVLPCCLCDYDADFAGLTAFGRPVLAVDPTLRKTLEGDLTAAAFAFLAKQPPAKPTFAPLDGLSISLWDRKLVLRGESIAAFPQALLARGKPLTVVTGPPGCGKSAVLEATFYEARKARDTCVACYVATMSGPRELDAVLYQLLRQLGIHDALRGLYLDDAAVVCAFVDHLRAFSAPAGASVVLLFVDDGDIAGSRGGLAILSNVDQSTFVTANDIPVRIIFTAADTSSQQRLFIDRAVVPSLREEDAVAVLVDIMTRRGYVVGPKSEAQARSAGVHIAVHKEEGCRPLYMSLAADALQHWSEEVSMISIADVLPPTCAELARHLAEPAQSGERVATVLAATSACAHVAPESVPFAWLSQLLGESRSPHDERGGPRTTRHGKANAWGTLVDPTVAPLVELDIAATRRLLPSFIAEAPRATPAATLCRATACFGSATVDAALSTLFRVPEGESRPASVQAERGSALGEGAAARSWLETTAANIHATARRLLQRHMYVAFHRWAPIALRNIHPGVLSTVAGPEIIFHFVLQSLERELGRAFKRAQSEGVIAARASSSNFSGFRTGITRHWSAIIDHPCNVFNSVLDGSDKGTSHSPLGVSEEGDCVGTIGRTPLQVAVDRSFDVSARARRVKPVSARSIATGRDPRSPFAAESFANPVNLVESYLAVFVFVAPDSRHATIKGMTDAVDAQRSMRYDSFLQVGELCAVAPPTFAECSATRAVIATHPSSAISRVQVIESDTCTSVRAAVSALQRPEVVIVSLTRRNDERRSLQLLKVAVCTAAQLPMCPPIVAMSGAAPALFAAVAPSGQSGTVLDAVWSPSVAVACGANLLVWPAAPRGADDILNGVKAAVPTVFEGPSCAIEHASFSPGGAKICALDSSGMLFVWGTLESPCPALVIATSRADGVVHRVIFATHDEVLLVGSHQVTSWSCSSSHVRTVISAPTKRPYAANFAVASLPVAQTTVTAAATSDNEDAIATSDAAAVICRPRLAFTFVDFNGTAVTWVEDGSRALAFAPQGATISFSTEEDLSRGARTLVASRAATIVVDSTQQTFTLCRQLHSGVNDAVASDHVGPDFDAICLAASENDEDDGTSMHRPFRGRPKHASITGVATIHDAHSDRLFVVAAFRRRYRLKSIDGRQSTEETSLLIAFEVVDGASAPPVPDLVSTR